MIRQKPWHGSLIDTNGFTLLEMLCSLAIIALVASLAVPMIKKVPDGPRIEAAARLTAASLRLARSDAIAANREVTVVVDAERRLLKPSNRAITELPTDIVVRMKVAKLVQSTDSKGAFRFFPDGTSSGGDIDLTLNARSARISVNWLDGEAELNLSPDQLGAERKALGK